MSPERYPTDPILKDLEKVFPEHIVDTKVMKNRRLWAEIKPEGMMDIMTYLHRKEFDHLSCISGMDYGDTLGVVYHLWSYSKRRVLQINMKISTKKPVVPSLTSIWKSADWHERETYDLMGIKFKDHPNLKRIYLPDDWKGHPLRKKVKLKAFGWFTKEKRKE